MFEEANEIFDFLPINQTASEEKYISHLWDAFSVLSEKESIGTSFALMPFHLLFMLSLQYKILRVAKTQNQVLKVLISSISSRNKSKLLKKERSVFDVALINERTMPEFFGLVGVSDQDIGKIKSLVDNRNDKIAHAKGWVELDPEDRIHEYLELLHSIQNNFLEINNSIASEWLKEMGIGQAGIEYMETHYLGEYLCPADMQQGKLAELDNRLNGEI